LDKNDLINYIKKYLPFECIIDFKNKNNHIIYIKKKLLITEIYIHPVFIKADKNIIHDIINFICNKDKSKQIQDKLKLFYHENKQKRKTKINHKYTHIDILKLFNECIHNINNLGINLDLSKLNITWGKNYKNRLRSIRFGSFDKRNNLIRIHPVLDNNNIPTHFIISVIYHEIAHYIINEMHNDLKPHHKEFYKLLKKIDPDYKKSYDWEKDNKKMFFNKFLFKLNN